MPITFSSCSSLGSTIVRVILKMSLALLVNRMNQLSLQCRACIDYHCLFLWLQDCHFHRQEIMVQCHLMRGAYPPCPLTCYTVSVLSYNKRSTQQKTVSRKLSHVKLCVLTLFMFGKTVCRKLSSHL